MNFSVYLEILFEPSRFEFKAGLNQVDVPGPHTTQQPESHPSSPNREYPPPAPASVASPRNLNKERGTEQLPVPQFRERVGTVPGGTVIERFTSVTRATAGTFLPSLPGVGVHADVRRPVTTLRRLLARQINNIAEIKLLCYDANLPTERINFSESSAELIWQDALVEAQRLNKLTDLLRCAADWCPLLAGGVKQALDELMRDDLL